MFLKILTDIIVNI